VRDIGGRLSMFHRTADFAFTRVLEASADRIRAEAEAIRPFMVDWQETHLHDRCWQVYGLFGFPAGEVLTESTGRCPYTTDLISRHVPTHGAAGFSLLKPHSRIHPHRGYAGPFLRCHLPLWVPQGDCALRVQEEVRNWTPGECLVFDDRVEHEVWNLTPEPRIVLLLDFVPPA
jgi:beta-hydroxylase